MFCVLHQIILARLIPTIALGNSCISVSVKLLFVNILFLLLLASGFFAMMEWDTQQKQDGTNSHMIQKCWEVNTPWSNPLLARGRSQWLNVFSIISWVDVWRLVSISLLWKSYRTESSIWLFPSPFLLSLSFTPASWDTVQNRWPTHWPFFQSCLEGKPW